MHLLCHIIFYHQVSLICSLCLVQNMVMEILGIFSEKKLNSPYSVLQKWGHLSYTFYIFFTLKKNSEHCSWKECNKITTTKYLLAFYCQWVFWRNEPIIFLLLCHLVKLELELKATVTYCQYPNRVLHFFN